MIYLDGYTYSVSINSDYKIALYRGDTFLVELDKLSNLKYKVEELHEMFMKSFRPAFIQAFNLVAKWDGNNTIEVKDMEGKVIYRELVTREDVGSTTESIKKYLVSTAKTQFLEKVFTELKSIAEEHLDYFVKEGIHHGCFSSEEAAEANFWEEFEELIV